MALLDKMSRRKHMLVSSLILVSRVAGFCDLTSRTEVRFNGGFSGWFLLDLNDTKNCLDMVMTDKDSTSQFITSYASFLENFFTFRKICINPPLSVSAQLPPFDFGIYGTDRGGGGLDAAIDIVGKLHDLAQAAQDSVNDSVPLTDWWFKMNGYFNQLRDAHVDIRNDKPVLIDTSLQGINLALYPESATDRNNFQPANVVAVVCEASAPVVVDGTAIPKCTNPRKGNTEIKSIGGLPPLKWFEQTLFNPSTLAPFFPFKSVGARMSRAIELVRNPLGGLFLSPVSRWGEWEKLTDEVPVEYVDGTSEKWFWRTWFNAGANERIIPCIQAGEAERGNCFMKEITKFLKKNGPLYDNYQELLASTRLQTGTSPRKLADKTSDLSTTIDDSLSPKTNQWPLNSSAARVPDFLMDRLYSRNFFDFGIDDELVPGTTAFHRKMDVERQKARELRELKRKRAKGDGKLEVGQGVKPRSLQDVLPLQRQWWPGSDPTKPYANHQSMGFWQFNVDDNGEEFAVLKIVAFDGPQPNVDPDFVPAPWSAVKSWLQLWDALSAAAASKGVTRLLVDVNGNPGGAVEFAYSFVRSLFPKKDAREVCQWYDRPAGPSHAEYDRILAMLGPSGFLAWIESPRERLKRFLEIKSHPKLENQLGNYTQQIRKGMNAMARVTEGRWKVNDPLMKRVIEASRNNTLTFELYDEWIDNLKVYILEYKNPWEFALGGALDPVTLQPFQPYDFLVEKIRGGVLANFTSLYVWQDQCVALFKKHPATWKNPFRKVLILSDGTCGSSCDTSSRTAHTLAKLDPKAGVTIKYITYGGIGGDVATAKETLAPTSFQGGNAQNAALSVIWTPLMQVTLNGLLMMEWAGFRDLTLKIQSFFENLPQWPFWAGDSLPGFSQSQIYQRALGPTALPMEYYFVPTDFFLPDWYRNIGGFDVRRWDEMELERVYSDASKAFTLMPQPDDGPNLFIRILHFILRFLFWIILLILFPIPLFFLIKWLFRRIRGRGFEPKDGEEEVEDSHSVNDSETPENLSTEGPSV